MKIAEVFKISKSKIIEEVEEVEKSSIDAEYTSTIRIDDKIPIKTKPS